MSVHAHKEALQMTAERAVTDFGRHFPCWLDGFGGIDWKYFLVCGAHVSRRASYWYPNRHLGDADW